LRDPFYFQFLGRRSEREQFKAGVESQATSDLRVDLHAKLEKSNGGFVFLAPS
jgi:hypothetical protein